MCGIVGYTGHRPAVPIAVKGLKSLEYRGYDSAGVAFVQNKQLTTVRAEGKLVNLESKLEAMNISLATSCMGHTRWATHGAPTERNAHPHKSWDESLAIVHNGIIENYQELKDLLTSKGYGFRSDTDSEVFCNLIAEGVKETGSLEKGLSWAVNKADGAYSVLVMEESNPCVIYGARCACPFVLGVGQGENFVASDIPAFLAYTRDVVFLEDGEMVRIDANSWTVKDAHTLTPIEKEVHHIEWDVQAAQKDGYKHFMLKEIFEQPRVVKDCLAGRVDWQKQIAVLPELSTMPVPKRLHIVACGTSFNAGQWAQHLFESWARIPVTVEIASEFRYRDVILDEGDVVLVISQSGETADTLAALRIAKERGIPVVGLCNVVGSSIARESDITVYTQAGPEISVASTKAMCSQMAVLLLMGLSWADRKDMLDDKLRREMFDGLRKLPEILEAELPRIREDAKRLAREYSTARSFFFLGRGVGYPLAMEGALKLKEISYIHAEGYAAGEMKHGPIALIDPEFPTFAIALNDQFFAKVKSNLEEVQARAGDVIALTNPNSDLSVKHKWVLPEFAYPLSSFLVLPALQLFSYEAADYLGKDVDQPRNLAKSVTVE
ncbi:glutamine--fructose-6-phosphate transaminase (isomerizing) [Halodesulfovibrio marinisediminis]|uniref:Glutamine--fructose-6-phosphate aminotransferase [isomerizing] n=1 Tax=Halodesulfovibrio marinisediminis DSM 17456 TaxID=1121457 RepID=A0A1N6FJM8_9BACT|nr:glutamine--fructose-6-phosphate transaminase (isomerizing) [Halodesulfovibrio marinisediminis]SIN95469.1 glutamine--fructose-6-phosphate transaminase [Halodesulfovibrio marinisediminis DSM 17456]